MGREEKNIAALWERIRLPQQATLVETLGIKIEHIDGGSIRGTMPVDHRTHQYFGLLHGGASVALAETLASIASMVHVDMEKEMIVGLEINANHVKTAKAGTVTGIGKPVHVGHRTQVWAIEIRDESGSLLCISRCTIAVVPLRKST